MDLSEVGTFHTAKHQGMKVEELSCTGGLGVLRIWGQAMGEQSPRGL